MRNQIRFVSLIIAVTFLFIFSVSNAQNIQEEVTVTAEFEPSIPIVSKLLMEPPQGESEVKIPTMVYKNQARPIAITLNPENIAPVKLVGEPQKKLYRNYVKAGLGTYTTPLLEFYAGSLRSKEYALGVHFKHLSSSGKIEGYPLTNNSLNLLSVNGKKFLNQHTLSGDVNYRRNVVHHYGFKTGDFDVLEAPVYYIFTDDMLRQRFNRIDGGVGIKSNYKDDDMLNHFASIRGGFINDLFGTSETGFKVSGGVDKQFELLDFTDNQKISLTTDVQYTRYKDSVLTQNNTHIALMPSIGTSFNEYSMTVGLNLNFKLDTLSKAYLFPFVEGKLKIINDALTAHVGITGGLRRQSFDGLSNENPFVQSVLPLKYTRDKFIFYAGLRGRISSFVDISAHVKSSSVENAYFFVNDFSQVPYNRFTLIHDNGKVLEFRADAQFRSSEKIIIKAFGEVVSWQLDSLENAYHVPATRIGTDITYQLQNKIIARINLTYNGDQYARVVNTSDMYEDIKIKGFADISLGLEYRYTKVLSGFLNFNNITNTRYFKYYNYPSYRFNIMGGITYSF